MPKVSVIIPVYNVELYLHECLDSVINQTLKDIEIICINDGSTDNSLTIIENYAEKDPRIIVFSQENSGQSATRNNGLSVANGDYICFMDSDDLLECDALEYLWNEASKNNLDVLYFDAKSIFETEELKNRKSSYQTYYKRDNKYQKIVPGEQLFSELLKDSAYRVSPCLQLICREFLNRTNIKFVEGIIYEDNIFTTEVMLAAHKVSHRAKPFYIRRVRENSIMTKKETFHNLYSYLVCVTELLKFAKNYNNDLAVSNSLNYFISFLQKDIVRIFNILSIEEKMCLEQLTENQQKILTEIIQTKGKMDIKNFGCSNSNVDVSVVIPVFKVENYLRKCLDSICGQSLRNIEIICIDDGSPDESGKICDEYAKRDKRITVIHQENAGLSEARNKGISVANGKYIAFVDSDDWVHPNFLEALYRLCEDNNCTIAECGLQKFSSEDELVQENYLSAQIITGKDAVHGRFELDGWRHGVTWNKLYRRELFDDVLFPKGKQHEDEYTTYKLLWKANKYALSENSLYYYRQRPDSIMGQKFSEKFLDVIGAYEERSYFFKDKDKELYHKSLIVLYGTIQRLLKQVNTLVPARKDLVASLERKNNEILPMLHAEELVLNGNVSDYPIFPKKLYSTITEDKHYYLKNEYNSVFGVYTKDRKISVIIPVYNAEKYLPECLDSVLGQSITDIEVIAVNDGSTDNSVEILKQYADKDERLIVLEQPNLGVFTARNRALRRASGQFVCFMDSDDFYPDNTTLQLLYEKAIKAQVLICGGSFSNFKDGEVFTEFSGDNEKYRFYVEGLVRYKDYQFDYGYHRFIYNRKFLINNDIVFPPYKRFQDPPFFVKAMILAGEFYAVPDVVYRYRVGFQAKPSSWPIDKLRDMLRGYLDNLIISREYGLEQLHALTVKRIEDDYTFSAVMEKIVSYDYETLDLVLKLNAAIDVGLLKKANVDLAGKEYYVLREIKNLVWRTNSGSANKSGMHNRIEQTQASEELSHPAPSFSRILTFVPRKIFGGIQCYKEHGLKYTLKRTLEHLGIPMGIELYKSNKTDNITKTVNYFKEYGAKATIYKIKETLFRK